MTGDEVRQVFEAMLPQAEIERLCAQFEVIERQPFDGPTWARAGADVPRGGKTPIPSAVRKWADSSSAATAERTRSLLYPSPANDQAAPKSR